MRKNKRESAPSKDITVKALMSDVFGLNRSEEQKARSRKEIPWQWALWGALLFFCVGFLVPTESLWIILLAIGVAIIVYMARASEAVEPQVFLLTDNRTPEQKAAYERRSNKPRRGRQPRKDKLADADKPAEAAKPEVTASEETSAKPARKPRKPRAPKKESVVSAEVADVKPEEASPAPVAEAPVVEAPAEPKPEAPAEEAKAETKPKRPRRPRSSKPTGGPRPSTPRRPRKPKVQAALTTAPVSTEKNE